MRGTQHVRHLRNLHNHLLHFQTHLIQASGMRLKVIKPVSLDEQSFNENVILNENSHDVKRIALQNSNVTEEDYTMSS